ncbi:Phage-related minor tail protein [compost metagenome]
MAATMTIPTEFRAIDRFTSVLRTMSTGVSGFVRGTATAADKVNKKINGVFNSLSNLTQLALGVGVGAFLLSGVDSLKQYESQVQSFRTIVSDLNDKEFAEYRQQINAVAKDTKKSSIDVAMSFEKIAGLNADLAKTADGLGLVSKAAITLSKASGDELGPASENLVGIMNQFSLGAKDANRVINVLAAGQSVGASTITQSAEAYKNFGSVAKGANITLEESQGLIQTLGKYSLFGAEAGTKLRGVTLQLQKAGLGYKSGQFKINDALAQANTKFKKLGSAKKQDAYLTKLFGAENITAGKILLNNIGTYEKFTTGVTGTSEAQKAAAINSDTLAVKIDELKSAWINHLTSNNQANEGMNSAKKILGFLADNIDDVVKWSIRLVGLLYAIKAITWITTAAIWAYNVALGIQGALSGQASIAIGANAVALGAYKVASGLATAAQWALNVAMTANPIGLIIVGIAALIALVAVIIVKWNEWGAALSLMLGPLGMIISLIMSFKRNWDMIEESFSKGGILEGFKAIGVVIFDALLMPLQQVLELLAKIPGMGGLAGGLAADLSDFRRGMGVNMGEAGNSGTTAGVNNLSTFGGVPQAWDVAPTKKLESPEQVNARVGQQNQLKGNININVKDKGRNVEQTSTSGFTGIPVTVTPTQGAY